MGNFKVGQSLINITNGIIGTFIKEFYATGHGMIIHVRVPDGRIYYAPSHQWRPL